MSMLAPFPEADICLILEGSYPYVAGGVSTWTQDLIKAQAPLTFSIVALTSDDQPRTLRYELPDNVVGVVQLQGKKGPNPDFSLEDGAAALTVLKAPLRATVKSKRRPAAAGGLSAASWGRPTVSLAIDRELQFDVPWGSRAKPAAKELPKAKGGNPLTDSALFRRLGEIDSLWKGGEKKVEAPVKSWSFLKRA